MVHAWISAMDTVDTVLRTAWNLRNSRIYEEPILFLAVQNAVFAMVTTVLSQLTFVVGYTMNLFSLVECRIVKSRWRNSNDSCYEELTI